MKLINYIRSAHCHAADVKEIKELSQELVIAYYKDGSCKI
jgi:hypothetical protein